MASTLNATGYTVTSTNVISSIVQRDSSGNFSAGTISAALSGNATTSTTTTGNAGTATALQTARNIGGVSFDGTGNIVPQTIASVNETSDTTCFPLFINDAGSVSDQPKNNVGFKYNAATNYLGISGFNVSGSTLAGTATVVGIDNTYGAGNYYGVGGNGRNIGVASGGPLFISYNLDYNATSSLFKYNVTGTAFIIQLSLSNGSLGYAVSGTAGNTAAIVNSLTWDTTGNVTLPNGNLSLGTAGNGLNIKGGSNARIGTGAVLVAGTVTVSTSAVVTGDIILLTCTAAGGTQGFPRYTINSGVSFTITSLSTDTSTYAWVIVRPT